MDFVPKRNVVRRIWSGTLFEVNKYGLLTIKFIPGSTLDLLAYIDMFKRDDAYCSLEKISSDQENKKGRKS